MRIMSLTLSCTLLLSSAAIAETKAPADDASRTAEKAATTDKKICKQLPVTGTRREERVCLTKAEWKKVEEEAN